MKERSNLRRCLDPVQLPFFPDGVTVRCGKCANCLRHRGNELAVRVYNQSLSGGYCHWITFTYRNESCPLVERTRVVDTWTGEILDDGELKSSSYDRESFFDEAPFEWRWNRDHKRTKRYHPLIIESPAFDLFGERFIYRREIYFSVDMSAFQRYMKCFRFLLDESTADSMKYCIVPEYGGVGYRPHFHAVFTGISLDELSPLLEIWRSEQGEDMRIDTVELHGKSDFESIGKISSYISKYACKGKYDCPYIISGNCRRPRRCSSIDFGFGDVSMFLRIMRHLLAFDVYGPYSAFNPPELVSPRLIASRRYWCIGDIPYPVPRLYIDKFFRRRNVERKGFSRYVTTFNQHKCYKVFRFYRYEKFDGQTEKVLLKVPVVDFSGDCTLSEYPIEMCVFKAQKTRYVMESSPLQKEVTAIVLADLCANASRELESARLQIKNNGFSSFDAASRSTELIYRYSAIRSFQTDLERSFC